MLGNPRTINALKEAIRIKKPKIVFLMVKKLDREWMGKIRDQCGFKQGLIVPSRNSRGELALLWKDYEI